MTPCPLHPPLNGRTLSHCLYVGGDVPGVCCDCCDLHVNTLSWTRDVRTDIRLVVNVTAQARFPVPQLLHLVRRVL